MLHRGGGDREFCRRNQALLNLVALELDKLGQFAALSDVVREPNSA